MSRRALIWVRWIGFALMLAPFVVAAVGVGIFRMDFAHVDPAERQKAVADAISFVYWIVGLGVPVIAAGFVMLIVAGGRLKSRDGSSG